MRCWCKFCYLHSKRIANESTATDAVLRFPRALFSLTFQIQYLKMPNDISIPHYVLHVKLHEILLIQWFEWNILFVWADGKFIYGRQHRILSTWTWNAHSYYITSLYIYFILFSAFFSLASNVCIYLSSINICNISFIWLYYLQFLTQKHFIHRSMQIFVNDLSHRMYITKCTAKKKIASDIIFSRELLLFQIKAHEKWCC